MLKRGYWICWSNWHLFKYHTKEGQTSTNSWLVLQYLGWLSQVSGKMPFWGDCWSSPGQVTFSNCCKALVMESQINLQIKKVERLFPVFSETIFVYARIYWLFVCVTFISDSKAPKFPQNCPQRILFRMGTMRLPSVSIFYHLDTPWPGWLRIFYLIFATLKYFTSVNQSLKWSR